MLVVGPLARSNPRSAGPVHSCYIQKPRQKYRCFLHFYLRKRTGLLSTYRVCIVIFLLCYGDEKAKGI